MPNLTIPESTYHTLVQRAAKQNKTVDDLAAQLLDETTSEDATHEIIDTEYHAACAANTTPVPTLEEVRAILAKIPGSLSADIIADRDER